MQGIFRESGLTFRAVSNSARQIDAKGVLADNLDLFCDSFDEADPMLIRFPPVMEPIGGKPQFFDIAYNYIAYASEDQSVSRKSEAGGGFMKMFGF